MTTKVIVTADGNGNIIGVSENNPEYGYIRVEQTVTIINNLGWLRNSKRSALIKGKVEDLYQAGFKEGQELPGRIVVKESFIPFNEKDPDKHVKKAGATGITCRVDDQPIYRDSFYTTDENAIDELITHTNTDEIRQASAALKELQQLQESTVSPTGEIKLSF